MFMCTDIAMHCKLISDQREREEMGNCCCKTHFTLFIYSSSFFFDKPAMFALPPSTTLNFNIFVA